MPIDPAIIRALTELGEQPDASTSSAHVALTTLRRHAEINRLHWSDWDRVCEPLAIPELVAIARGLTLAESHHRWIGGSVAAVIWVFRHLQRREYTDIDELTDWILSHTTNSYVPFGSNNFGARTVAEYRAASARHSDQIVRGLQAQANAEREAENILQLRAGARKRAAELRSTPARSAFLRDLESLPVEEQLKKLARDDTYPVEFYPTRLAYAATAKILSDLDRELRLHLLIKLKGKRRGPWAAFKRRLRDTFEHEIGRYGMPWDRRAWFRS